MPEISRFFGIIIKMINLDDSEHHRPHVHVYYGEYEASVSLEGTLLAGALPLRQFKLVAAWLILHECELNLAWNAAVEGKTFEKVEPLS